MICGNGVYPATFAAAARRAGVKTLVAACFEGETDPAFVAQHPDFHAWLRVGQLSKLIKFFYAHGVRQCVMVGQIAPKNLFEFKPDLRITLMLAKLKERNAETLFGGIAQELAKDEINLLLATTFLEDQLAAKGHLFGPKPDKHHAQEAEFGLRIAKQTSALDIGQSVVVRRGTVLAVEAFEGTNECIRRGGSLGKGRALLAKVSKPNQDLRFDVPVIGRQTLETCRDAGVTAIAVEAGQTLILQRDEVSELAQAANITVLGCRA